MSSPPRPTLQAASCRHGCRRAALEPPTTGDLVIWRYLCAAGMFADSQLVALRPMDDLVKGSDEGQGFMLCAAGMFADLQLVALRAMDDLVDAHKLVLASAAADDAAPVAYTNEWMASARWHPFWLFALAHVLRANESRCTSLG